MPKFSKSSESSKNDYHQQRIEMVKRQIERRGIIDKSVLEVMRKVPRHLFVPEDTRHLAYNDGPLCIGFDQTISQPYIVASMTEYLHPAKHKHILEIGTGSGYQTAVLAELFDKVDTVEVIPDLLNSAREILSRLEYSNISFHIGDGLIIPESPGEFDAIIVTAAPHKFPDRLADRLNIGGRMVIPVGSTVQTLILAIKDKSGEIRTKPLYSVRFVPLLSDN